MLLDTLRKFLRSHDPITTGFELETNEFRMNDPESIIISFKISKESEYQNFYVYIMNDNDEFDITGNRFRVCTDDYDVIANDIKYLKLMQEINNFGIDLIIQAINEENYELRR
jgi:hypothetical protein